ncbi:MAG: phage tail length tape measure family protein [Rhizobiales bacterium]|nr:phage tail length tape measure family protein [Hyphomicrobiales bacterium]
MATVQEAVRRLSIQATTSGVDAATTKLDELSDAQQNVAVTSQQTEKATLSLETRFASIERRYVSQVRAQQDYEKVQRQVNAAVSQNPVLQERANAVLEAARQRMEKVTGAANDNAGAVGLARHELINLSRQAQDVGVSLAGGQSPLTVLFQQGSQIGDIFTSSQGSLRGFASQVAAVLTPVRLMALGLVAIGAAAFAAFASWKSFALALDDVSRQAGAASSSMAKLQASASFKGIGQNDFVNGIQQFSAGVYEAQHGLGELAAVFRANGKSATDFNSAIEAGADIIKNAASDQQRLVLLQQMGLPATMQWVRLMSDGAEGIRRAKDAATQFGGAANDNMVARARQFDESWNRAITNLRLGWNRLFLDVFGWFDDLSSKGTAALIKIASYLPQSLRPDVAGNVFRVSMQDNVGTRLTQSKADEFYGAVSTTFKGDQTSKGSVDKNALSATMGLEQQRIGILSQMAGVADQVRSVELQVAQARLNGVRITASEEVALKALARENALGVTQMRAQADATNVQAATFGMSAGAAAAFTAEQNRLNEAVRNHQVLTDQDKAKIREWAAEVGRATETAARAAANDNIRFGRQTALLSPDDVQIAQQLRGIYPDVATALGSVEAAGLRTNAALSTVSSSMSGTMVTALADVADGTKSVGQGAADMWKSFSRAIQEMIIKLYIVIPLMRSLQAASGMVGGFLGLGWSGVSAAQSMSATGFSTMTTGGLFHSGGLVGNPATSRSVDPAVFHGAPRYHGGGIAGLMPDEVPAILQRGERVIPRGQSAGGNVSITINGAPGTPKITQQDRPNGDRDIMIDFANAVKDVMVEDAATDGRASRAMQARAVGFGGR